MPEYSVNDAELKERIEWNLRGVLPPEIRWEVRIETWLESNVELKYSDGVYSCIFWIGIGLKHDQFQPTIDYTVKRILDHDQRLPPQHKAKFRQLAGSQRFVMLFTPNDVGGITTEFVSSILPKLLPNTPSSDLEWVLCPVGGSDAEKLATMQVVVEKWSAAQAD